ncbi:MAG: PadR family transcriptional regulator [Candidatus Bathyarchaeia archaeon]
MAENFRGEIVQRIIRNLLDIQILRLINVEPMWGYMIKKRFEAAFGLRLRHGALYPMLNALEGRGLLKSQRQQHGGRTRKVYTITERGREYLEVYNSILKEQIRSIG